MVYLLEVLGRFMERLPGSRPLPGPGRLAALTAAMGLGLLLGCGSGGGGSAAPAKAAQPAHLSYTVTVPIYPLGAAIPPNTPSFSGGPVAEFTVAPRLPAGLGLHAQTGVISGIPWAPAAEATYRVTARNAGGSSWVDLTITVTAPASPALAPAQLNYSSMTAALPQGVPIRPIVTDARPVPTAGGFAVRLDGTGFSDATGVTVGPRALDNLRALSDSRIEGTLPAPAAPGDPVIVTTPMGVSAPFPLR
jgi:hypothetical protein